MEPSTVIQQPDPTASHGGDRRRLRAQLHGMWASVAPAWAEHADYADTRGADITASLLELAAPRPGERVLELACGAGGVGIATPRTRQAPAPGPPRNRGPPLPDPDRARLPRRLPARRRAPP